MTDTAESETLKFVHTDALPADRRVNNYFSRGGQAGILMPYQLTGWQDEGLSWKKDVYLHTMTSGTGKGVPLRGPDAEKLMDHAFVNSFSLAKFPVGAGRHIITCAPNGNIGAHGMCLRTAEDEFITFVREPFISVYASSGAFDVEPFRPKDTKGIIFQIGGPRSLELVENLIGEDIHDLKFMKFKWAKVLGKPVRVVRMGMAGTLSYEVHSDDINELKAMYEETLRLGEGYGLKVLGRLSYMSNHTENGYPQQGYNFMPDWSDPAVQAYMGDGEVDGGNFRKVPLRGSLASEGREAYHLNPFEAGWGGSINWDHDFVGKDALMRLKDDPNGRKICSLEWDPEGVLDVFRTYFDDTAGVAHEMQMPQNLLENPAGNLQDKLVDGSGKVIGKSAGRLYTLHYKKMISMAWVDPAYAEIGKEVTVIWGEPGSRQIPIKAKVARYPYLDLPPNRTYDLTQIPRYHA